MFDRESVDNETADVITIFHTLDHLTDPLLLLEILRDKLKHGGQVVNVVHNTHAISARILKSRSPIFDIEHTFLFSRRTLVTLLHKAGYEEIQTGSYWNQYSLAYIVQLLPIQKSERLFANWYFPPSSFSYQIKISTGEYLGCCEKSELNSRLQSQNSHRMQLSIRK